jgi:peptidyl-prolyl cis-trans isomerase SurA
VYPSFEEARPALEQQAAVGVQQAGAALVNDVRKEIGVRVNPRFGVLDKGQLVAGNSGVVDILGSKDTAAG